MVATHHHRNDRDTADVLRAGLVAATAAPSIHNTQPWLFRLREDGVDVLVDSLSSVGVSHPVSSRPGTDAAASPAANSPAAAITATIAG